eukprot:3196748-Pleurochrysis_carterae.AAC.1
MAAAEVPARAAAAQNRGGGRARGVSRESDRRVERAPCGSRTSAPLVAMAMVLTGCNADTACSCEASSLSLDAMAAISGAGRMVLTAAAVARRGCGRSRQSRSGVCPKF